MKALIVISGDLYVRNFIETGVFSEIEGADTYYVASESVKHVSELKKKGNFIGRIRENKWRNEVYRLFFFPYLTFAFASKSSSFKYRSERLLYERQGTKARLTSLLVSVTARLLGRMAIPLFSKLLGVNKNLRSMIDRVKPDIVIIPSSAFDVLGTEAVALCKRLRIPTMMLINGWDNLSSKIVFPVNPDFLCVWGHQSTEFARKIHGIPPTRVFEIGVPAFDEYFHIKKQLKAGAKLKSHYGFDYALFAGCAVAFDELSALKMLEKCIEEAGLGTFKVVYRPHPWRQKRSCDDYFDPKAFKHVVLDKQMVAGYLKQQSSTAKGQLAPSLFLPSLDYYPSILHNARFVISPLSTMTLEALIFERPVLTLVYNDGIHITSPHNLLNYDHFDGIDKMDGVIFCKKKSKLSGAFLSVYENTKKRGESRIMEQIRYYIHYDDRTYAQRLKGVMAMVEKRLVAMKKGTGQ
jgi:hypothetical protein